jgi:hypothetical protein
MDTRRHQTALLASMLFVSSGCVDLSPNEPDDEPGIEVSGTGQIRMQQITFGLTVEVARRRYGHVTGTVLYNSRSNDGQEVNYAALARCLKWEGNSVWIGGTVDISSNRTRAPIGERVTVLIRDLGGPGQDIMHAALISWTSECVPISALPETVVSEGNYTLGRL